MSRSVSFVLPAKNEAASIGTVVGELRARFAEAEILVVDDGSDDDTAAIATRAGARVVRHPVSRGNGAAIKTGARNARGDVLVFMDADGQHDPAECERLLARLADGYDMVVGSRSRGMHASVSRLFGNSVYNQLASWITGQTITDLTSGFRAVRAPLFRQFLALLPNGFSYPTTITMAFMRAGYGVAFEPVQVRPRKSQTTSHINLVRDGGRFLLIIFRVGTLYSPLKIFVPISLALFSLGAGYYAYTLAMYGRFTNLGALLLSTSVIVFLIGLISEQITALQYLAAGARAGERE